MQNAAQKLENWNLLAAILMPDHLHALETPKLDRGAELGNCSAALKRWIRQEMNASWNWQAGCFDRLLRNDESPENKWSYMRNNPVRAGLVQGSQDWPYQIGLEDREAK